MSSEVSVVIPLYNKGPYIARALKSALTQTFQNFEVIVVDDGSTDDGAEVVRSFDDPRIRLIQQDNMGVSAARNRGIEAAKAELIAFLDADDEWLPYFLETVIRLRDQFPDAGAYSAGISVSSQGGIKQIRYRSLPSTSWEGLITNYFRSIILGDPIILSSSVAIPKYILQEMNGFLIGAEWGEDLDLWGRIALKYPVAFSTSSCVIIHQTAESMEKLYARVALTTENPFIRSAVDAINNKENGSDNNRYMLLYLNNMILRSALYNSIRGENAISKEILDRYHPDTFYLVQFSLRLWNLMPDYIINSNKILREKCLRLVSYMLVCEVRTLTLFIECKNKS